MSKKVISTQNAPQAIGPYSQAIEANGMLFISGQIPMNAETGKLVEGDITVEAEQVMKNIEARLKEAGYIFTDVVTWTVVVSDIDDYKAIIEVYGRHYYA